MKNMKNQYGRLSAMTILSFISMYALMYAMVNAFANVVPSYNQIYMAGLMTAPMVILELLLMGDMYPNKKRNIVILACSSIALLAFWVGIRQQVAVGDVQMLKSMIPHHAGAVLMCGEAALSDSEAKELCRTIVSGQQAEIAKMKDMLTRLQR